jgi:hypothetical protein
MRVRHVLCDYSAFGGISMQSLRRPVAVATLMGVLAVPAFAGQRGNSGNHGPSTHPAHPNGPANAGPKTNNGAGSTGNPHKSGTTPTATTTSATTPTAINFNTTAVGSKLTKNVALQSKLATRLTALGYGGNVFEAAYGFKNLGQFVAATNVSQNLGIPFEQLRLQMTGLTVDATGKVLQANLNPDGSTTLVDPANVTHAATSKSLGQSIQTLKPTANATTAATTATSEAETEIEHTTTTTSKGGKKKS